MTEEAAWGSGVMPWDPGEVLWSLGHARDPYLGCGGRRHCLDTQTR